MIQELYKTLSELYLNATQPFVGIGILVCDDTKNLPIYPLYQTKATFSNSTLYDQLNELLKYQNKYHDGFHILNSDLTITHTSQYFYPSPFSETSSTISNDDNNYGVRYFVAKLGSMLPNVLYSAIVGKDYGVCIFKDGKEIKVTNDA